MTNTDYQTPNTEVITSDQSPKTEATEPIPPANNPKQYRAIGLLQGKYVPSSQITQGTLLTSDGTSIDAVILGRLLGLLKSRIDLEKEHLWVVYPRTKNKVEKSLNESGNPLDTTQESEHTPEESASPLEESKEAKRDDKQCPESPKQLPDLSNELLADDKPRPEPKEALQELSEEFTRDDKQRLEPPKQLQELSNELKEDDKQRLESPESPPEESEFSEAADHPRLHVQMAGIWEPETLHPDSPAPVLEQKPDYFSIQGEVVYQHQEEGWVMVKIIQSSRQNTDGKPQYFKLKISGFLPGKAVKNFWQLHVKRVGNNLVIEDGERIAYLGKKKPKKGPPKKKPRRRGDAGQQPAQEVGSPKEPPKLKKKQPAQ